MNIFPFLGLSHKKRRKYVIYLNQTAAETEVV